MPCQIICVAADPEKQRCWTWAKPGLCLEELRVQVPTGEGLARDVSVAKGESIRADGARLGQLQLTEGSCTCTSMAEDER